MFVLGVLFVVHIVLSIISFGLLQGDWDETDLDVFYPRRFETGVGFSVFVSIIPVLGIISALVYSGFGKNGLKFTPCGKRYLAWGLRR